MTLLRPRALSLIMRCVLSMFCYPSLSKVIKHVAALVISTLTRLSIIHHHSLFLVCQSFLCANSPPPGQCYQPARRRCTYLPTYLPYLHAGEMSTSMPISFRETARSKLIERCLCSRGHFLHLQCSLKTRLYNRPFSASTSYDSAQHMLGSKSREASFLLPHQALGAC